MVARNRATDRPTWKAALNADPTPWLLQKSNLCVRWRALRELLDKPDSDPEVKAAAAAIPRWKPIAQVLEMAADPARYDWPDSVRANTATPGRDLGQVMRLGIPTSLPQFRSSFDPAWIAAQRSRGTDCYQPQFVLGLLHLAGKVTKETLQLVERVAEAEQFADGNRPASVLHGRSRVCSGSHSCHFGAAHAIDCVASVPTRLRTPKIKAFLERSGTYLAAHNLYLKNHGKPRPIVPAMSLLHQPWQLDWQTDILHLLDIATRIGMAESLAIGDALRELLSKQDTKGRFPVEVGFRSNRWGDRPLVGSLLGNIEPAGGAGKWVTLQALLVLKRCPAMVKRVLDGEQFPPPSARPHKRFTGYPHAYNRTHEQEVRELFATIDGITPVLDALVAYAKSRELKTGWYDGFVMGPSSCREWLTTFPKMAPAKNMKVLVNLVRTNFLTPRGMFTTEGLAKKLGVGLFHEYARPVKPGSWVQQALWRVKVDRWNGEWDVAGIAFRDAKEVKRARKVLDTALTAVSKGA